MEHDLQLLIDKLIKDYGISKQQANGKVVTTMLGICANNPDLIELAKDIRVDINLKKIIESNRERAENWKKLEQRNYREYEESCNLLRRAETEYRNYVDSVSQKQYDKMKKYIEDFNKKMFECGSEESRDTMRKAQVFINNININSKYDNTAYIIGLSQILTNGKVDSMQEYKKMNPLIFD